MNAPQTGPLCRTWERGAGCSPAGRGLLLLELALPDATPQLRAELSIGHRDSCLIDLRERLFGGTVEAISACEECGETIAISFDLDQVRAPHAAPGTVIAVPAGDRPLRFRPPNSTDLIAIEEEPDFEAAERRLLDLCLVDGRAGDAELALAAFDRISRALSDADPQAELMLEIQCPECSASQAAPFDILTHLWSEVADRAVALFEEVDLLAARYGWSEADILAMSPARRGVYLDLIGTAPA